VSSLFLVHSLNAETIEPGLFSNCGPRTKNCELWNYLVSFLTAAFFTTGALAGLLLPKDPLKIFPFFVFLSPLPINVFLVFKIWFTVFYTCISFVKIRIKAKAPKLIHTVPGLLNAVCAAL
jgi:hypothetical protein